MLTVVLCNANNYFICLQENLWHSQMILDNGFSLTPTKLIISSASEDW